MISPGADSDPMKQFASISMMTPAREQAIPHICVCICTYKRPLPLRRLLTELSWQSSGGLFTFSIVVADNDATKSAEATVADCRVSSAVPIEYRCEPRQGIARARNKVVENAVGDYLAFIDDDEFPAPGWLIALFQACNEYKVDGVLGPVIRYFDEAPPTWLKKSRLFDRRVNPTGMRVGWREARTGNVLLRKEVIGDDSTPFRPEFRTGEDQDFFRRKIEEGRTFIWCAQAEANVLCEKGPATRSFHRLASQLRICKYCKVRGRRSALCSHSPLCVAARATSFHDDSLQALFSCGKTAAPNRDRSDSRTVRDGIARISFWIHWEHGQEGRFLHFHKS
jgi:hypothetical protein